MEAWHISYLGRPDVVMSELAKLHASLQIGLQTLHYDQKMVVNSKRSPV